MDSFNIAGEGGGGQQLYVYPSVPTNESEIAQIKQWALNNAQLKGIVDDENLMHVIRVVVAFAATGFPHSLVYQTVAMCVGRDGVCADAASL